MENLFRKIAQNKIFHSFITVVIVLASVLVGMETYPNLEKQFGKLFDVLDIVIIIIFSIEILVKMAAEGLKPWRYFLDPWNVFDFLIVAVCFLPFDNQYITVLRLIRLLRVLRLLRAFPKLQILVAALFKSLPSIGYVILLMGLLFYVFAVAGVLFFSKNDPVNFGTLTNSLLSLFKIVTLEAWVEIMNIQLYGCEKFGYEAFKTFCTASVPTPLAPLYFISFILLGTFLLLNLFIGVIMNGMEEARNEIAEAKIKGESENPREADLRRIEVAIDTLNNSLKTLNVTRVRFREKKDEE